MRNILIAIGVVLSLSGCAVGQVATQPIPASFLQPCERPSALLGITGKDLTDALVKNGILLHKCADEKKALIDAVKIKQE
jgi:hypothetical protein